MACVAFHLMNACNGVLGIPEVELRTKGQDAGSVSCAQGKKSCSGACVSLLDPDHGCAAADCEPCALAHAKAACFEGACAIEVCEEGFSDCNDAGADGCEVDLSSDQANCRECGNSCAEFRCVNSVCVCTTSDVCGFGGTCNQQTCNCGGTTCSHGSPCSAARACEF